MFEHKKKVKTKTKNPYKHFNLIGWDNVSMILLEKYPCNSKQELKAREHYWITELHPKLNIK